MSFRRTNRTCNDRAAAVGDALNAGTAVAGDWHLPAAGGLPTSTAATNPADAARDSAFASLSTTATWIVVRSNLGNA